MKLNTDRFGENADEFKLLVFRDDDRENIINLELRDLDDVVVDTELFDYAAQRRNLTRVKGGVALLYDAVGKFHKTCGIIFICQSQSDYNLFSALALDAGMLGGTATVTLILRA